MAQSARRELRHGPHGVGEPLEAGEPRHLQAPQHPWGAARPLQVALQVAPLQVAQEVVGPLQVAPMQVAGLLPPVVFGFPLALPSSLDFASLQRGSASFAS